MDAYSIVIADQCENPYDGSDVPGEFRRLTEALGCEQVALTLIRIPPHSDFEQGTFWEASPEAAQTAATPAPRAA